MAADGKDLNYIVEVNISRLLKPGLIKINYLRIALKPKLSTLTSCKCNISKAAKHTLKNASKAKLNIGLERKVHKYYAIANATIASGGMCQFHYRLYADWLGLAGAFSIKKSNLKLRVNKMFENVNSLGAFILSDSAYQWFKNAANLA